jgi:hypothetical protein
MKAINLIIKSQPLVRCQKIANMSIPEQYRIIKENLAIHIFDSYRILILTRGIQRKYILL